MNTPAKLLAAPRFVTLTAGCNQLINWGISFYMPGTFARSIAQETDWATAEIYLGLTLAMFMMAIISPFVARLLARFGGQRVVVTGTLMISAGCLIMAYVHSLTGWYAAWLLTGVGMRLALYDALFAALVNIYGQRARLSISRVTLAGGLASALFWPLGAWLLTQTDWRHALLMYALFGVLSATLLWGMPNTKLPLPIRVKKSQRLSKHDRRPALLYASFCADYLRLKRHVDASSGVYRQLRAACRSGDAVGNWANGRSFSRSRVGFHTNAAEANDIDDLFDASLLRRWSEWALSLLVRRSICIRLRRDQWPDNRI